MHAVVVMVTVNDPEAATKNLREVVVPGVQQAPGVVAGYWTRKDDKGIAMVVFDSERIPSMAAGEVTVDSVEVREVVANV